MKAVSGLYELSRFSTHCTPKQLVTKSCEDSIILWRNLSKIMKINCWKSALIWWLCLWSVADRQGSGAGSRKSSGLGARSSAGRSRRQVALDGADDKPYQMSNPQAVGEYSITRWKMFNCRKKFYFENRVLNRSWKLLHCGLERLQFKVTKYFS